MNIEKYIYDKIYWAIAEGTGMIDKYVAQETTENFWKEVIEQEISLDKIDEHLRNFVNEIYSSNCDEE